ncbi:MAG: radical SAM protein [Planctomycetes bacterium]|nr:radical SAM protein [Planctomycetota bacterium]
MLRITEYIRDALSRKGYRPFSGTIVIWNITNNCNLSCKHCYANANQAKGKDLDSEEAISLIHQLKQSDVKFAILSGGEPLLRDDIFDIASELKNAGIKTYLSTNGILVSEDNINRIKEHIDYIGISIDGETEIHDSFRGRKGAFEDSMRAIRLCLKNGLKVGVRFTLTENTQKSLPFIFGLARKEGIPKIYISHLVYSGMAGNLRDVERDDYWRAVEFILKKSFEFVEKNVPTDVVTGNNDADAVMLLDAFKKRYPDAYDRLYERLKMWGGNQAGKRLVNIDSEGNVKPDPFFHDAVGNVRTRSFCEIWNSNGILSRLRENPRRLRGRCGKCAYIEICNGNSRARAYARYGNYYEEDPACYI